jgi:tripartite-type tricarboxylate transporter receptor subunit TctC
MSISRRQVVLSTSAFGMLGVSGATRAATPAAFPERAITIVDPFAAGSNTDYFSRALGDELAKLLGQPVIVENRSGSGGAIGAEAVARAKPDGHVLGLASVSTLVSNPAVNKALRYDPLKDFAPVTTIVTLPSATVVLANSPVKSLKDLIQQAKAAPDTVSFASPGAGSAGHVLLEQFAHLAGVKFLHVPYRGSGGILNDLFGGQVQVASDNIPSLLPHIKSGRLRALAVRDVRRVPGLPDVPTFKELGFEAVSQPLWFGLVAPAGTPRDVVARLNQASLQAMRTPAFLQKVEAVAGTPSPSSPEEFQRLIADWLAQFRKTVQVANITL